MSFLSSKKVRRILGTLSVIFFLNIVLSIYLTQEFYSSDGSSICAINDTFDCLSVSKSQYGVFLGFPVAIWGILFYTGLFIGSVGLLYKVPFEKINKRLTGAAVFALIRYFTYFGLFFALYLTYIEAFVLYKYCIFCLAQQVLILIAAALVTWARLSQKRS